jgi:hypothetical protein
MMAFKSLLFLAVAAWVVATTEPDPHSLAPRHLRLIQKMSEETKRPIDPHDEAEHAHHFGEKQPKRPKRVLHDTQERLREGTELLELAKSGDLFDIEIGDVYEINEHDLHTYMEKVRARDLGSL